MLCVCCVESFTALAHRRMVLRYDDEFQVAECKVVERHNVEFQVAKCKVVERHNVEFQVAKQKVVEHTHCRCYKIVEFHTSPNPPHWAVLSVIIIPFCNGMIIT
jgi:hypothetical protein